MIVGPDGRCCLVRLRHRKIKLSGQRTSTLYLDNPARLRVERIEVDGCAIVDGIRCDWLVRVLADVDGAEIFVELKGADLHHGIRQLEETILRLSSNPALTLKRCLIACRRVPLLDTQIARAKVRFRNQFSARFEVLRDGANHAILLEDRRFPSSENFPA